MAREIPEGPGLLPANPGDQPPAGEEAVLERDGDAVSSEGLHDGAEPVTPVPLPALDSGIGLESRAHDRRWTVALTPMAVALVLIGLSVVGYLLAPDLSDRRGLAGQDTPAPSGGRVGPTATALPRPTPAGGYGLSPASQDPDQLLARAAALGLQSDFEGAIAIYQDLVESLPGDARPEIQWAWALLFDDLPDQALDHARRAMELDPGSAEAAAIAARAYAKVGDPIQALKAALQAVHLDAESSTAHAALAEAYLVNGQLAGAVEHAEMALTYDRANAEAHRIRGLLYQALENDIQLTVAELQVAVDLQPGLWVRPHELGIILLEAQDYPAAVTSLTDALVLRHKAVTYTALGQAYYEWGDPVRAQSFLEQSLSAGATDADTYALLAALHAQRGRCDDARFYYSQALAQDPEHALALESQATCELPPPAKVQPTETPALSPSPVPALAGRIVFPIWNEVTGQVDTYMARAVGSERRLIVEGMHQPTFSPDGAWLALNGERHEQMDLFVARPDGSALRQITEYIEDALPCWSPDGEGLAFSSRRHADRQSRVYVVDRLPLAGEKVQERPIQSDLYEVLGESPAWLADGRLVYRGCDPRIESAHCGLFLVSAEPGLQVPEPLTDFPGDSAPAAYGSRIAFMSDRDGNWEIYVVGADGTGLARLTQQPANDGLPAWSPDGRSIAFVSDRGGPWAIWAVDADGSNPRKLFDLGGGGLGPDWLQERISWGP
jgi:tetratricopeptide (TPR) repeat protein